MRIRKSVKQDLFGRVPLFSQCTKRELAALTAEADELALPPGRTLTREGERGREFVVIVEGAASVTKGGERINDLGPGDFLGEIALLDDVPRTATVTTTEDSVVLVLTDRAFRRVADEIPSVRVRLLQALSQRLHTESL